MGYVDNPDSTAQDLSEGALPQTIYPATFSGLIISRASVPTGLNTRGQKRFSFFCPTVLCDIHTTACHLICSEVSSWNCTHVHIALLCSGDMACLSMSRQRRGEWPRVFAGTFVYGPPP